MPARPRKLVLFDVDGTLLKSHGGALRAMTAAAEEVFGAGFDLTRVDRNGRLDPQIIAEAVAANGAVAADGDYDRFRDLYLAALRREIGSVRVLPGVRRRLAEMESDRRVMLGLVTGNYAEAARIKLAAAGIADAAFLANAFAEDADSRGGLVRHAMAAAARRGAAVHRRDVVIVGDTPRDVAAAEETGCRCLAVATGNYSRAVLEAAGKATVVDDLLDPAPLLSLLGFAP